MLYILLMSAAAHTWFYTWSCLKKGRAETDIELTVVDQPFHCLIIFVGYVFTSKDHIRPYLENAETGPSIQWAKAQGNNNPSPRLHKNIAHLHEIKQ